MGRNRRPVSDKGYLICWPDKTDPDTKHAAHISEFYGVDTPPLTFWVDPVTRDEFGRPSGYCKEHMKRKVAASYVPRRAQWFDEGDEALIKEAEELPFTGPATIESIKERAGKMGPPKKVLGEGWDEEPIFPER
jgi:hypothetical protein